MAKTLQEVQNENKSITKQLSKCVSNESAVSKNYEELNARYVRLLTENKTMKENILGNKVMNIIPKMKSTLDSCKIIAKKLQGFQKEMYKYPLDPQINKSIIPYGYGTWVYDQIYDGSKPEGFISLKNGKVTVKPGLFKDSLTEWNQKATSFPYTQIYSYCGDIEMYCRGSGQSDSSAPCIKANGYEAPKNKPYLEDAFLVTFPGECYASRYLASFIPC